MGMWVYTWPPNETNGHAGAEEIRGHGSFVASDELGRYLQRRDGAVGGQILNTKLPSETPLVRRSAVA
jgi:hypothetical protein